MWLCSQCFMELYIFPCTHIDLYLYWFIIYNSLTKTPYGKNEWERYLGKHVRWKSWQALLHTIKALTPKTKTTTPQITFDPRAGNVIIIGSIQSKGDWRKYRDVINSDHITLCFNNRIELLFLCLLMKRQPVCVCECVRESVRARVCVCVSVGMCMWFMRTQICIMTWVWQVLQGEGDLWGHFQCPHNLKRL